MSMRQGRPSSLDGIKRHAKRIKAEAGLKHARALDEAAKLAGFHNFAHANGALASKGIVPTGRQPSSPPLSERRKTMPISDFKSRMSSDWVRSIDALAGVSSPRASAWETDADIERVLSHVMGSERNHAFLPDGGGRDFHAVMASTEPGCLDFRVGRRSLYRVKPQRLILERIEERPAETFFLLELDTLKPTGTYDEDGSVSPSRRRFQQEEVVEVAPGHYYERSVWDEGCTDDGEELPDDAELVIRFLGGKIMLVSKGSLWNGLPHTYDGRHAYMTSAEIRVMIEGWLSSVVELAD